MDKRVEELETFLEDLIHVLYDDVWGSLETKKMLQEKILWELFPLRYGKDKCLEILFSELYDIE